MTWRGPTLLALLLVVGVGGGFLASVLSAGQPAASGVPTPVVASSPSYPVDPEPELADDPDVAPLPVDLPMTTGRVGTRAFRHVVPVPEGWEATPSNANETKWRDPDNPPSWTYVLRVEQVGSDNLTVQRVIETRISDLDRDEEDFTPLARTSDSLTFSYVSEGHLRIGVIRWVRPSGGPFAEVEVAATGRAVDRPGLEALVADVSAGVRRA